MDNEYIYLKIPSDWICTYHKLLVYMADYGKTIIDDCTSTCKGNGKNIISCWNIFQSAIASYELGKIKEANFFIEYIEKQLSLIYKNNNSDVYNKEQPIEINEDGELIAYASCNNKTKFNVDLNNGLLYRESTDESSETYNIENNNLIVEYKN